jgi:CyaY protein
MTEQDFQREATTYLGRVAAWVDRLDDERLDRATSDGIVTLEFDDGTKYVLNRQSGAHQLWFAAGARAWHYDWKDGAWRDDRDGHRLDARLAEVVSAKLGRPVDPVA